MNSAIAMIRLLTSKDIKTVIDIGSGLGHHAEKMRAAGKDVTTVSLCEPADYIGDFMNMPETHTFDAVWASHVLEHQLNPNLFLKKCFRLLKDNGLLVVTVPPLKNEIVGGHINLYNPGLLVYQCILAGFDCSMADVLKYDYNISIVVRKREAQLPELAMDAGDIERLEKFFPFPVKQGFDGLLKGRI